MRVGMHKEGEKKESERNKRVEKWKGDIEWTWA